VTLPALRDDALSSSANGATVRLSLPWIRSLPLSSVDSLQLSIDGNEVDSLTVALGDRRVAPADLERERGWWFLQDRLVLVCGRRLRPGSHDISVSFRLVIPYLQMGPDGPLVLPFQIERSLILDAPATPSISRNVA
jgi:hypothetical protein